MVSNSEVKFIKELQSVKLVANLWGKSRFYVSSVFTARPHMLFLVFNCETGRIVVILNYG